MKTLVILDGFAELEPTGPIDEELQRMPSYKNSRTGEEGPLSELANRDRVWWPTPWLGKNVITFRKKADEPARQGVKKKRSLRYPIPVELI